MHRTLPGKLLTIAALPLLAGSALAQLNDQTQAPNTFGAGILKSLTEQIGAGRGDINTPGSSLFIIGRDPFRSIRRGRQIFQRKFQVAQGQGPRTGDGVGNIEVDASIAAGLADSCAACHSVPFGGAGSAGNVFTRPDSRDAPHLFGLGLVEMLADEITKDLRLIEANAKQAAMSSGSNVTVHLTSKGISYGTLTARSDGSVDTSNVDGVNPDLRVRPFFHEGTTISMREFIVGAFNAEMGLEPFDPDLLAASNDMDVTTPAGMELTGSLDAIEGTVATHVMDDPDGDGVVNEIDVALVDHFEFYLLNYFKPGVGQQTVDSRRGQFVFGQIGCAECHIPNLLIKNDRRVADVETNYDPVNSNGYFSSLAAVGATLNDSIADGSGHPDLKPPLGGSFLVRNIFADFKRHDLGREFHENNFDGSVQTEFMTEPLWGAGSTAPYGHDGRSMTLRNVILRHGNEAAQSRENFLHLSHKRQGQVLEFIQTLVIFSPEDTPSNLSPKDEGNPDYPLKGHGAIALGPLFNDPSEGE